MSSFGNTELLSCAPVHTYVVVLKPWFSRKKLNMTFILIVRNNVNINNQGSITNDISDVVWQFNDSSVLVPLLVVVGRGEGAKSRG